MKKLTLIAIALVAMAATFTSCKKDTTNDAAISLAGDTGYTATDATVAPGATFTVKWTATCTTTNMAFVSITKDGAAQIGWTDKEIASSSESTYVDQATLTAPLNVGAYVYAIVIEDKDKAELVSKSITITVSGPVVNLDTYTNLKMGGSDSNFGSYLDAETGSVYTLTMLNDPSQGAARKATVDMLFDISNLANKDLAGTLFPGGTGTKFATSTLTAANFDALINDNSFSSLTATLDNIEITVGDVVFFVTGGGKKGYIKVIAMTSATGDLTIDEKIQK